MIIPDGVELMAPQALRQALWLRQNAQRCTTISEHMLLKGQFVQTRMRGKAARALLRYTKTAIDDLQHDEDEMLRGQQEIS